MNAPTVPNAASTWKFSHLATWGFFVAPGDELLDDSSIITSANQDPILVNGSQPLIVDRLRVKRNTVGYPIRGPREAWVWEWWDPDQDEWLEIGFASGPKELEEQLFKFFVRVFGGWDVAGPDGFIKEARGAWDRFSWTRAGGFGPQTLSHCRSEYWEQRRALLPQQLQRASSFLLSTLSFPLSSPCRLSPLSSGRNGVGLGWAW